MSAAHWQAFVDVEYGFDCVLMPGAIMGKPPLAPDGLLYDSRKGNGNPVVVGDNTIIGCHAVVYEDVHIGRNCLIGDHAVIREGARIGDNCVIGMHVTFGPAVLFGKGSKVMDHSFIAGYSSIGTDVFIGPHVATTNDNLDTPNPELRGLYVGRGVRIGARSVFLPGVTLLAGAQVATGSVVTRDVPEKTLVMGSPARIVGPARGCGSQ